MIGGPSNRVMSIVEGLSLDDKAQLTVGATLWTTNPAPGVPTITLTDGPAGARGPYAPGFGEQTATLCIPCGSALGATFDDALVERLGAALGDQARAKTARVLLAPTVNLHRSPLAGRNFECYSEDPLLSGKLAAGFVRGVQSQGVATTVKHFVGNDAEFERMTIDSVIDHRTLRELYLVPFELAVKEGGSLGIMTAYNRLNGTYCAENKWLLQTVLRDEWGFRGFVVTDWFAGCTTEGAAEAGLDLEMPFPARAYGRHLGEAVREGRVDEYRLDRAVITLLSVWEELGALDDEPASIVTIDRPEHRALAREASASSMVLLANRPVDGSPVLPLDGAKLRSIAVIGPNAERARFMGGGSAEVMPHHRTPLLEALRARLGDRVELRYEYGCSIDKNAAMIDPQSVRTPDGRSGFDVVVTSRQGDDLARLTRPNGRVMVIAHQDVGVPRSGFGFRATGLVDVPYDGDYVVSLVEVSPCRLLVNGELAVDGTRLPPPGEAFFGLGRQEITGVVQLSSSEPNEFVLECDGDTKQWTHGAQIGLQYIEPADPVRRAADVAAECDVALVVVGTNNEWESEGHDRTTLDLPGRQAELIREVAAANRRTIVLVNTGAPVDMSWVDEVPATVQVWFGGQEMSEALVDVLLGERDPGGRLPTTIPMRLEHTPPHGNFPGEHGQVRYGEGVLMGYRWYEARGLPVRFPFGHGLSYTTFDISSPDIDLEHIGVGALEAGAEITVRVDVTNTGSRSGEHVVQLYVAPLSPSVVRPPQELKGFRKVRLASGASTTVEIRLTARAFAHWDAGDVYRLDWRPQAAGTGSAAADDRRDGHWRIDPGAYEIRVGSSSADIAGSALFVVSAD